MTEHLLPSNATEFERAASLAIDTLPRTDAGVAAIRTAKHVAVPDEWVPFLVYEYGLGPVSVYVADQRALLSTGIDWQRVRGTPDAVSRGLDWLSYGGEIEDARSTRRLWNAFQIGLDRYRRAEDDLVDIHGVVSQSVPLRSRFTRAFWGHDIREMEWGRTAYSGSRWSGSSGVVVSGLSPVKWSFGRVHDLMPILSQYELELLGAWQPSPIPLVYGWGLDGTNEFGLGETSIPSIWVGAPWTSDGLSWMTSPLTERSRLITAELANRPVWVVLRDGVGNVIGYRRARVARAVDTSTSGIYHVGHFGLSPGGDGAFFYIEARLDFRDGYDADEPRVAALASLLFDGAPADTDRPGLLWAAPGEITGGVEVGAAPVSIDINRTTRERLRFLLTYE